MLADLKVARAAIPKMVEADAPLVVEVIIEIPRGSFLKRGSTGTIDFVSPLPCPFNYGSVPQRIGLEGDLLDAVVLGPRLAAGTRVQAIAHGAVGLAERGLFDDKLICSAKPVNRRTRQAVTGFFHVYIQAKRGLNLLRGRPTDGYCTGWGDSRAAFERSRARDDTWDGPSVVF